MEAEICVWIFNVGSASLYLIEVLRLRLWVLDFVVCIWGFGLVLWSWVCIGVEVVALQKDDLGLVRIAYVRLGSLEKLRDRARSGFSLLGRV
eukprot:1334632-Amorphochlora_amoeboformis.AAC.2